MSTTPIYVFAQWQVKEGQLQTVLQLLQQAAEKSRQEAGNLFYKIHQGQSSVNHLVLYEAYKDEAALAAHRDSAHFQAIVVQQIVPLLEKREVLLTTAIL